MKDKQLIIKSKLPMINDLTNSLKRILAIPKQKIFIMSFYKIYHNHDYKFMSSKQIFNKITKLL
jgi:hypothetical protein